MEQQESRSKNNSGNGTILIAEDNEQVRKLAEIILESNGYSVLTAVDGESALEVLHSFDRGIDLLLTDLLMPGMNGRDLFYNAREIYKPIKVIFMSGYTDDIISSEQDLEPGGYFIQKPFTINQLVDKVREALES